MRPFDRSPSSPPRPSAARHLRALAVGLLAVAGCVDDGPELGATAAEVDGEPPPLMAFAETYRQADIVRGRPLPPPVSKAPTGGFTCDTSAATLGVLESRSADGVRTYRLRCARSTLRGVYEDHLAISVDERHGTDVDRAMAQACVAAFNRYKTPRNEYFSARLELGRVACATGPSAAAIMMATSNASGGFHPATLTPGAPPTTLPPAVIPPATLQLVPTPGQQATLPTWAVAPAAPTVITTAAAAPIHFAVVSRADPQDLTGFDPTAYPSQIIGYTLQVAAAPSGLTSCDSWHDVPGLLGEEFVALHDTPIYPMTTDAGIPVWKHALDVPLPPIDFGPFTDMAALSHTLWVRVVPRGPVLGGQPGDPPPIAIDGFDASPCALVPSDWVPIGVFDDATLQQAIVATIPGMLEAYLASLPYDAKSLYDIRIAAYAPPRLQDRAPIMHTLSFLGFTFQFPTTPIVSEVENDWGAHRGIAFDPYTMTNLIAAAHSHWYDGVVALGSAFVDLVGFFSSAFDAAKTFVASNIAVAGCQLVPVQGCETLVQGAVMMGIDAGLASMGIPPHLPNARELMNGGVDYLATMAADQVAVGVPGVDEVARAATEAAVREALQTAIANVPSPQAYDNDDVRTWGAPDAFYLSHPAQVTITIRPKSPSAYATILATERQRVPDLGFVMVRDLMCGYAPLSFRLPRIIPPQGIHLTLPLTAGFEKPASTQLGTGCVVPQPAAWASSFGALDPTNEATLGVRYPGSSRYYLLQARTFNWLSNSVTTWDSRPANAGLPGLFAGQSTTGINEIPVPKPLQQ